MACCLLLLWADAGHVLYEGGPGPGAQAVSCLPQVGGCASHGEGSSFQLLSLCELQLHGRMCQGVVHTLLLLFSFMVARVPCIHCCLCMIDRVWRAHCCFWFTAACGQLVQKRSAAVSWWVGVCRAEAHKCGPQQSFLQRSQPDAPG
jgi:hypothetical protein